MRCFTHQTALFYSLYSFGRDSHCRDPDCARNFAPRPARYVVTMVNVCTFSRLCRRAKSRAVSASASHYARNWPTNAIEIRWSATSRNELAIKQQFDTVASHLHGFSADPLHKMFHPLFGNGRLKRARSRRIFPAAICFSGSVQMRIQWVSRSVGQVFEFWLDERVTRSKRDDARIRICSTPSVDHSTIITRDTNGCFGKSDQVCIMRIPAQMRIV